MVALLELSKDKTNEEFSTNMTSEPQDLAQSAFEASPQHHSTPGIEEVSRDNAVEAVQTGEA